MDTSAMTRKGAGIRSRVGATGMAAFVGAFASVCMQVCRQVRTLEGLITAPFIGTTEHQLILVSCVRPHMTREISLPAQFLAANVARSRFKCRRDASDGHLVGIDMV